MLTYCNWLLVNGVFHDVQISFLPVGHTHIILKYVLKEMTQMWRWMQIAIYKSKFIVSSLKN
jgi:hypothetical protein